MIDVSFRWSGYNGEDMYYDLQNEMSSVPDVGEYVEIFELDDEWRQYTLVKGKVLKREWLYGRQRGRTYGHVRNSVVILLEAQF